MTYGHWPCELLLRRSARSISRPITGVGTRPEETSDMPTDEYSSWFPQPHMPPVAIGGERGHPCIMHPESRRRCGDGAMCDHDMWGLVPRHFTDHYCCWDGSLESKHTQDISSWRPTFGQYHQSSYARLIPSIASVTAKIYVFSPTVRLLFKPFPSTVAVFFSTVTEQSQGLILGKSFL